MFKVRLDFHDNAIQMPREFESYTDLTAYLEGIPSMIGFQMNGIVEIKIENNEVDRDCDIVRSCLRRNGHKGAHSHSKNMDQGVFHAQSIFDSALYKI
jgi:hypothetical protein